MTKASRRAALKTIAAAAAAPLAAPAQQHQHGQELLQVAAAYQPKVLTPAEMRWVAKLVDAIIPRTDTPGASDAGVPAFIDRRLNANATLAARFREGMKLLDAAAESRFGAGAFSALNGEQQVELLTPISENASTPLGGFFKLVKGFTIDGYYTSKEGLVQELGWRGNTFLSEFKGCTHPEHQA